MRRQSASAVSCAIDCCTTRRIATVARELIETSLELQKETERLMTMFYVEHGHQTVYSANLLDFIVGKYDIAAANVC
jgi:hypothetical protein